MSFDDADVHRGAVRVHQLLSDRKLFRDVPLQLFPADVHDGDDLRAKLGLLHRRGDAG